MASPKVYILSAEADRDFEEIFDYIVEEFDLDQTVRYLTELESIILKLTDTPEIGKNRDEIKPGLKSFPFSSQILFY
ncbi:MAG: type II toxin-antitoxin system RelE/ParE family toxin [Balneolaceae bacterium]|nr:type II toxin-antitoxin system RelE/ParE family toxin [Balneolaceae bacterium]